MTLDGVMTVILRYFSEFGYLPGVLRKSSRSLSHLLMSSCFTLVDTVTRNSNCRSIVRCEKAELHCEDPVSIRVGMSDKPVDVR